MFSKIGLDIFQDKYELMKSSNEMQCKETDPPLLLGCLVAS